MLLTELLNSKIDLKYYSTSSTRWTASSVVKGRKIEYYMKKISPYITEKKYPGLACWAVSFSEIVDSDSLTFDLSGNGGELEVLSGLKKFLDKAISTVDPDVLFFSAKNDSKGRSEVYRKMVKRWLPTWDLEESEESEDNGAMTRRGDMRMSISFTARKVAK